MVGVSEPSRPSTPFVVAAFEAFARLLAPPIALPSAQVRVIVGVAFALAVWTDVLFYRAGFGINFPVWVASLVIAAALAGRRLGRPLPADRLIVLGSAVLLSSVVGWRDSDALQTLGVLGTLAMLGLGFGMAPGSAVRTVSPVSVVASLIATLAALFMSWWRLVASGEWQSRPDSPLQRNLRVALRSLVIVVPLLLVFGSLFMAADAVFAAQAERIFVLDIEGGWTHAFLLLGGFAFSASALSTSLAVTLPDVVVLALPERHRLGRVEVGIVLGLLSLLFAAFVAIQIRYLFGGETAVQSSVNLTYAEYARRGFFELVAVSVLLLPVLAGINWAIHTDRATHRTFLVLAVTLVGLLFVVMASAWQRLAIYRDAFGLTEGRFYSAAMLPWLAIAVVWFLYVVARRRTQHFLAGIVVLATALLLVLNAVNPDGLIARTNLARMAEGKPFDAAYAGALSADAVPTIVDRYASLSTSDQCILADAIGDRATSSDGVRSWNLARYLAAREVQANAATVACPK